MVRIMRGWESFSTSTTWSAITCWVWVLWSNPPRRIDTAFGLALASASSIVEVLQSSRIVAMALINATGRWFREIRPEPPWMPSIDPYLDTVATTLEIFGLNQE